MPTLVINEIDDECVEFLLDDNELVTTNHDEDGWLGMEKIRTVLERIAYLEGWEVMVGSYGEED